MEKKLGVNAMMMMMEKIEMQGKIGAEDDG